MSARQEFTRSYSSIPGGGVDFAATLVLGQPQLPEWFEMPNGGTIVFLDGSGTSVTYSSLPAGARYAVQIRKIVSATDVVRVGTNPMTALSPSVPSSILPSQLAGAASDTLGMAAVIMHRVAFTAGTTGSADDVTVLASAPFGFRIVDVILMISTAKGGATATLRTATGGGGSALSDALSVASTGVVRNASLTASPTVAAAGAIYMRRSDRACAGEVILLLAKS